MSRMPIIQTNNIRPKYIEHIKQIEQKKTNFFLKTKRKLNQRIISFIGVTILLSLTVFLNMVAEAMPSTSESS